MRTTYRAVSVVIVTLGLVYLVGQSWGMVPIPTPAASVEVLEAIEMRRVSYYQAVAAQTDSDPLTSACGPNLPRQVAVSRDLFRTRLECGTQVRVFVDGEHAGIYTVWDTMHTRWESTLDILATTPPRWGLSDGFIVILGVPGGI